MAPESVAASAAPRLRFAELAPLLRAGIARMLLAGLLPVLVFDLLLKQVGPLAGVAGGMGVSLAVLGWRFVQACRFDPIVVIPMTIILVQGSVALALSSVELYLAAPAVENLVWGLVLIGSLLVRRPLVDLVARELRLVPPAFERSPVVREALRQLTVVWCVASFVKAGVRLWLLGWLPLEVFLVGITGFHLVLNFSLFGLSCWWSLRAIRLAGS